MCSATGYQEEECKRDDEESLVLGDVYKREADYCSIIQCLFE